MNEVKKITEKTAEVLYYVRDNGGRVSIPELANALGREPRSINANVTDLTKKKFAEREKVEEEGSDKPVTYVVLTDLGKTWVPTEE